MKKLKNVFELKNKDLFENYNLKNMKKRILLLMILFIFVISLITFFLIINYLDPYRDVLVSIITIWITSVLLWTSFFSLLLYIFKKVYYRWEIFLNHVFSSIRQWFLITSFIIWSITFYSLEVFSFSIIFLYWIMLFFVEMLLKNISQ